MDARLRALADHISRYSLPGASAHRRLAPEGRPLEPPSPVSTRKTAQRRAAVLILLHYPEESPEADLHIPFILRPPDDLHHADQIALPGGMHEGDEPYPVATALRETNEEIGIDREQLQLLGPLSPLYVGVSNVSVTPVVGYSPKALVFRPDPKEVADYFILPLSVFRAELRWTEFEARGERVRAPYYPTEAGRIWGATAMMLAELIEIWERVRGRETY